VEIEVTKIDSSDQKVTGADNKKLVFGSQLTVKFSRKSDSDSYWHCDGVGPRMSAGTKLKNCSKDMGSYHNRVDSFDHPKRELVYCGQGTNVTCRHLTELIREAAPSKNLAEHAEKRYFWLRPRIAEGILPSCPEGFDFWNGAGGFPCGHTSSKAKFQDFYIDAVIPRIGSCPTEAGKKWDEIGSASTGAFCIRKIKEFAKSLP
jgi:hypothetical protein